MVNYYSDLYFEVEVINDENKVFKNYFNAKKYVEEHKDMTTGNIFTREFEDARKE